MSRLRSNSTEILSVMLGQKLTSREAAKRAHMRHDVFSKFLQRDRPIYYATASKLIAAFGEDSVTILDAKPAAQM